MRPVLIFDFDGTIANSLQVGLELANELSTRFKYVPIKHIDIIRNHSAVHYIFQNIKWYKLPYWLYLMKKNIVKRIDEIELYAGISELLHRLKKDFILGLIGGGKHTYHSYILTRFNCDVFDFKYANNGSKKHKIIRTLNRIYKNHEVVIIGDDSHDIKAAKKSGIKSIAVTWGVTSEKRLREFSPDFIATSVLELETYLYRIREVISD